jgi:hypothetical protein
LRAFPAWQRQAHAAPRRSYTEAIAVVAAHASCAVPASASICSFPSPSHFVLDLEKSQSTVASL